VFKRRPIREQPTTALALLIVSNFFVAPSGRDDCEGLTRVGEDRGLARCRLIAPDDDVDIEGIELKPQQISTAFRFHSVPSVSRLSTLKVSSIALTIRQESGERDAMKRFLRVWILTIAC